MRISECKMIQSQAIDWYHLFIYTAKCPISVCIICSDIINLQQQK